MRVLSLRLVLPALAAAALLSARPAGAETREVFTQCTNRMVENTLKGLGYAFSEVDNNAYRFEADGFKIVIFNKTDDVQLYAAWEGDDTTLNRVNEFNKQKRWAKAYLDDESDPVIEADLDFEGGVTQDAFERFIRLFVQMAGLYAEHLK